SYLKGQDLRGVPCGEVIKANICTLRYGLGDEVNSFFSHCPFTDRIHTVQNFRFFTSLKTIRTRRSSVLSTRLTKPFSTRRSTAILNEPGVRSTIGPIVFPSRRSEAESNTTIRCGSHRFDSVPRFPDSGGTPTRARKRWYPRSGKVRLPGVGNQRSRHSADQ